VPAAAVRQKVQALFRFTGRKGPVGGRLNWRPNPGNNYSGDSLTILRLELEGDGPYAKWTRG